MGRLLAVVVVFLVSGFTHIESATGTQVLPINFADLSRASVAFMGVCTAVDAHIMKMENGPGLLVTTYTFSVEPPNVIKGNIPSTYSFTTLGSSNAAAVRFGVSNVIGAPDIEVGKEYVVFLNPTSRLGLTSIVGLNQAKFNVVIGPGGKKQVINDMGNNGLFKNLPASASVSKALSVGKVSETSLPESGAIDYDKFINMAREITK